MFQRIPGEAVLTYPLGHDGKLPEKLKGRNWVHPPNALQGVQEHSQCVLPQSLVSLATVATCFLNTCYRLSFELSAMPVLPANPPDRGLSETRSYRCPHFTDEDVVVGGHMEGMQSHVTSR